MRRFSIPVWVAVLAMGPWDDLAATQTLWRGLVVAPESRCSPYDADDYRYPQSVEDRIIAELGGVYGPYTGRWFANKRETDIEHIVARSEVHDSGLCAAARQSHAARVYGRDRQRYTLLSRREKPEPRRSPRTQKVAPGQPAPEHRLYFEGVLCQNSAL